MLTGGFSCMKRRHSGRLAARDNRSPSREEGEFPNGIPVETHQDF